MLNKNLLRIYNCMVYSLTYSFNNIFSILGWIARDSSRDNFKVFYGQLKDIRRFKGITQAEMFKGVDRILPKCSYSVEDRNLVDRLSKDLDGEEGIFLLPCIDGFIKQLKSNDYVFSIIFKFPPNLG